MLTSPTTDLATIEASIEKQIDTVAQAPSRVRYTEILRLQMLREMRDILQEAYRFSRESADLCREVAPDRRSAREN